MSGRAKSQARSASRRTNVQVPRRTADKATVINNDGYEEPDDFWDRAETPRAAESTGKDLLHDDELSSSEPSPAASAVASAAASKEGSSRKPTKKKPRFSLPGDAKVVPNTDDDEHREIAGSNYLKQAMDRAKRGRLPTKADLSPSALSSVSTLAPSPNSAKKVNADENDDEEEEGEEEQPLSADQENEFVEDEFPVDQNPDDDMGGDTDEEAAADAMDGRPPPSAVVDPKPAPIEDEDFPPADNVDEDDDEDDDDDLVPPRPPSPEEGDEEVAVKSTEQNAFDDDDSDNDGPGFQMVHDPETPESVKEARAEAERKKVAKKGQKKTKSQKRSAESVDSSATETPAPTKKRRKNDRGKRVNFEAKGYQSGPRVFEAVPVTDLKNPPDPELRRSNRTQIRPLAFWKNERPIYGPHRETGDLGQAMGMMPDITHYEKALPTPYKPRKRSAAQAAAARGRSQKSSRADETEFDSRKLRKKHDFSDDNKARMWTEIEDDVEETKVISYADERIVNQLPLPRRRKSEGKVVGSASQAFNVPTDSRDIQVGFIAGTLHLPPGGIKDPESSGACSHIFFVSDCQPGSIEVAYSEPGDDEGGFDPDSAQRFLLARHDLFRVPPGNSYRVRNHSTTSDAILSWTIIRPSAHRGEE